MPFFLRQIISIMYIAEKFWRNLYVHKIKIQDNPNDPADPPPAI
jgi:hypothetical protein